MLQCHYSKTQLRNARQKGATASSRKAGRQAHTRATAHSTQRRRERRGGTRCKFTRKYLITKTYVTHLSWIRNTKRPVPYSTVSHEVSITILVRKVIKGTPVSAYPRHIQTSPTAPHGRRGSPLVPAGRWLHPFDVRAARPAFR